MNVISNVLKNTHIVGEQFYNNLSLHYLRMNQPQDINIVSYEETEAVEVSEVDEGGTVSKLRLANHGLNPVLMMEGIIFEGMKQNRFLRHSFILSAYQALEAEVCCTEQGRWAEHALKGQKSDYMAFTSIRSMSSSEIKAMLKQRQTKGKIQSAVWLKIQEKLRKSKSGSKTSYVGDYYRDMSKRLDEYTGEFKLPETANGVLAMVAGIPVEMTMAGTARILHLCFDKLVKGIAAEAIDEDYCEALKNRKQFTVNQFLNMVTRFKKEEYASVSGNGKDIRFSNKAYTGSALIADNNLIHMGVYAR